MYSEKKSGIFSGGGFGFTIGSQSKKETLDGQAVAQVGSTVGSTSGNVNITAGSNATVTGSNVISGQNTIITAQNVTIDAAINTSQTKQTYEFKQSGLTVSLGGGVVAAGTNLAYDIRRAGEVSDSRLKALYEYKAFKELEKLNGQFNGDWQNSVSINISLGSTRYSSQTVTTATSAQGSNLTAGGDVSIAATGSGARDAGGKAADGSVSIAGSGVAGQNVNLTAAKDINLEAADNTSTSNTTSSGSSAGVGVQLGPSGGVYVQGSKSSGTENEAGTTHTQTVVTASNTLTTHSGSDTNIVGGQAKGNTINMTAGGNLNVASQQDTETYSSRTSSAGGTVGLGAGVSSSVSASKGKTESTYASVTTQSGVYAGTGGFDIYVGGNTDLKGAVIASDATPDKNRLSTGTLTYGDIENKAEYKAGSVGVTASTGDSQNNVARGVTPNIGMPSGDEASSTTRSAVALGTIEVRNNPDVDLSKLSRDTTGAVNALGKIFDKKTVQERQELANLFGQEAFKLVGDLGLKEGSQEKIILDAVVGGIMSKLGGSDFLSGASGAALNQILQEELNNIRDPAAREWASALIGVVAANLVGGDGLAGGSTGVYETRYNYGLHLARELATKLATNPSLRPLLVRLGIIAEGETLVILD